MLFWLGLFYSIFRTIKKLPKLCILPIGSGYRCLYMVLNKKHSDLFLKSERGFIVFRLISQSTSF